MATRFRDDIENIIVSDDKKGFTFLDEVFETLDKNVIANLCKNLLEYDIVVEDFLIIEVGTSTIGLDANNFGFHEIAVSYRLVNPETGEVYNATLSMSIKIQLYILTVSKNITLEIYNELVKDDYFYANLYKRAVLLNTKIKEDLYLYVRL